jgi:hypothetical protein
LKKEPGSLLKTWIPETATSNKTFLWQFCLQNMTY